MEEITATFHRTLQRWDTSTALVQLKRAEETISAIVTCAEDELQPGRLYRFSGHFTTHPKYGRQFRADAAVLEKPMDNSAMVHYLCTFEGIGAKTAQTLVEQYGMGTLERIIAYPETLLSRWVSADASQRIARRIAAELDKTKTLLEVASMMAGAGFPRTLPQTFYAQYGVKSLQILRTNPYLLLQYDGCGFTSVDAFALCHGYNPNRLKRQALALLDAMKKEGDVWFSIGWVNALLTKHFGLSAKLLPVMRLMKRAHVIAWRHDTDGTCYITTSGDADHEMEIAKEVQRHKIANEALEVDTSSLSESQAAALAKATAQKIGCLVGGPGTGKTYTVARYIQAIAQQYGSGSVLVVAPTGKAVVRSAEMLKSIGVECACRTIHSLLLSQEMAAEQGEPPLFYRFIISDESSMIDAGLMARFLRYNAESSILFVGDDGQLLPVGKGRPFADFLQSGSVPVGRLTETMRNSGRIVQVCHAIRNHTPWQCSPSLDLSAGENLLRVDSTTLSPLEITWRIVQNYVGKLDIIRDIQVIVGVNKGESGRIALNDALRRKINPLAQTDSQKYSIHDPVICLKNGGYNEFLPNRTDDEKDEDRPQIYLSNGEIGYVRQKTGKNDSKIVVDYGDNKAVEIAMNHQNFDLAYAVTCHKMQGSETPIAIVFLDPSYQAKMVCTREWLYTAISRAKKVCYLIGSKTTADDYCRRLGNVRKTFLCEELRK